jgi:hypothetical protein
VALAVVKEEVEAGWRSAERSGGGDRRSTVAEAEDVKAETAAAVSEISLAVAVMIKVETLAEAEDVKAEGSGERRRRS